MVKTLLVFVVLLSSCGPNSSVQQAGPKLMLEMWLGEPCQSDRAFLPVVNHAWACSLLGFIGAEFALPGDVFEVPRVCIVQEYTTCTGWFPQGVNGCAGGRGIIVSTGKYSIRKLLVHEMTKWLILIHTDRNVDERIIFDSQFQNAEQLAQRCLGE